MADDASRLLRELELAPAHVIGASMGGMIAQTLAARHPEQVRSLVSIMSNTGAATDGQPSLRLYPFFLRRAPHRARRATSRTSSACSRRSARSGLPARARGDPRAGGAQLRPRPRPGRTRAPARGDHRLGRPHRRTAPDQRADARRPRRRRPARRAVGRPRDGARDRRREAVAHPAHGPRPAAGDLDAADRRDLRERGEGGWLPGTPPAPACPPDVPVGTLRVGPRGVPQPP